MKGMNVMKRTVGFLRSLTGVLLFFAVAGCQGGTRPDATPVVDSTVQDAGVGSPDKMVQTRVQGMLRDTEVEGDRSFTVGGVQFRMVGVSGGTFVMGRGSSDFDPDDGVHRVVLSDYYIGETEVTQALWKAVMGSEPDYNGGWTDAYGKGALYPAYRVGYDEVMAFIEKLGQSTGVPFRLPTEAEWEYAALGGAKSHGYRYSGSDRIADVACCSGKKTHPVAQRKPNELGLYDMTGNVFEWCSDWYCDYDGDEVNPLGADTGRCRVMRGGCWMNETDRSAHFLCGVANRESRFPDEASYCVGFRLAL